MTSDRYSHVPTPSVRGRWRAPVAGGPLRASVTVPGSKSLTNRELILAALADGPSRLAAPLHSEDSAKMIDALRTLGVGVDRTPGLGKYGDDLVVTPVWPLRGLHRGRLRPGRHGDAVRRGTGGLRSRRRHPHRA